MCLFVFRPYSQFGVTVVCGSVAVLVMVCTMVVVVVVAGIPGLLAISYLMSPYPTVVMVTTAHQNASGMDLKND